MVDIDSVKGHINNLKVKIETAKKCIISKQGEIVNWEVELFKEESKLGKLLKNPSPLEMSDHAMVRYIERKTGISISDLKNELITPALQNLVGKLTDGEFTLNSNKYVIKNRCIVTIV